MWAMLGFLLDHTSSRDLFVTAEGSNLFCRYTTLDTASAQNILSNLALDNISSSEAHIPLWYNFYAPLRHYVWGLFGTLCHYLNKNV